MRAHDQIGETIAVHIPCRGHTDPTFIVALAIDHEPTAAAGDGGELDGSGGAAAAEHHIRAASIGSAGIRISCPGTHDQVDEPIAVYIPCAGHAPATGVARGFPVDHEAADARRDGGELNGPWQNGADGLGDDQLTEPCGAVPHVEGAGEGTAACEGASVRPEAIEGGEGIAAIAGDQQLVALLAGEEGIGAAGEAEAGGGAAVEPVEAGEIPEVGLAQGEGVVARSREIKGLEGAKAGGIAGIEGRLAGHSREVEAQPTAFEGKGVEAAAAIDAGKLAGVAA